MGKATSKKLSKDFAIGLLLGFLVTIYLLLIILPMFMPESVVGT